MNKIKLLNTLREQISIIQSKIALHLKNIKDINTKSDRQIGSLRRDEQVAQWGIKDKLDKRATELEELNKSPYFFKCEIRESGTGALRTLHFSKFEFADESIYSWLAPISSIRFESPGPASYRLPSGENRKVELVSKEQYMIVGGKVMFFALESETTPRTLIHQEHFSNRKDTFVLPEIVSQMEKAQDQVVRLSFKGQMVISGPAGSGKTTLAFHRLAYLMRSPDTSAHFPSEKVIVFVQDSGTRDYFSHLLPELGINNVEITSFAEWAFKVLNLEECSYVVRSGSDEKEKDEYEYQKLKALRTSIRGKFNANPFSCLKGVYKEILDEKNSKLFLKQTKERVLDRFDLTLLLRSYFGDSAIIKSRKDKRQVEFSSILIDEFQNYLPEQLELFNRCSNKEAKSIIYIGDVGQQIRIGTIRTWAQLNNEIEDTRRIVLNKVYRNTKKILEYISGLGYKTAIPEALREGEEVIEKSGLTVQEEIAYIKEKIKADKLVSVGILAKDSSHLSRFKNEFKDHKGVHVLTMVESQGVEFDSVFIVGINKDMCAFDHVSEEHREERVKIEKDLLYIGLTRAMNRLHVLGRDTFKEVLTHLLK